jgi:hypothetical protein
LSYARISITLPEELLAEADRCAKELDRSRSWVVSDALTAYLAGRAARADRDRVREAPSPAYSAASGLGEQRLSQLRADLALTPEQRVLEAERTARAWSTAAPRWAGVLTFDRFEDYLAWKRREAAGQ